jgi:predicted O-methyltransferase YrrM
MRDANLSRLPAPLAARLVNAYDSAALVRLRMARRIPRLAGRDDGCSRALARTLRSVAFGAVPDEEREWIGRIEARRRDLASVDGEAGSPLLPGLEDMPVPQLNAWISIPPVWGLFLMRFVRELEPRSSLELGTGLGISGAYQAAALELSGSGRLTTLDGDARSMPRAEQGFESLALGRVETCLGPLDETLQAVLERIAPIDYAYLDADHTERATVEHFDAVAAHLSPRAAVVLDDIAWGDEMGRAWRTISRRKRVSKAVDLGRMGAVLIG